MDVLNVVVEKWPRGRRGAAEPLATMRLRPLNELAGVWEVEISYAGVPSRSRSTHTVTASGGAREDLWQLIAEALWPIGHKTKTRGKGDLIIDADAS